MTRRVWLAVAMLAVGGVAIAADKLAFEVYEDASGGFRWRLKAVNGKVLATSGQGYKAKADCTKMVDNFKSDIGKYTFEVYEDAKKEHRFRMKTRNGQTVGSSGEGYKAKADAEKAVETIKSGAKDAEVKEVGKEK